MRRNTNQWLSGGKGMKKTIKQLKWNKENSWEEDNQ
jgi:hypothetical protein